ncbi:MAG TPA: VOC family protein [Solirubrobacterales bacterium]|nr:VOC family protein [Solirubrobacterales bacterium]
MSEAAARANDRGLTHVALVVRDPEASIAFYARYARMQVVHQRDESSGRQVLWLSDLTRPFVIVLIQAERVEGRLDGFAHLGVGCETRAEVDRLCALAREEGRLGLGPLDSGYPVGYWAFIRDPDGHNLEISYGQEVGFTVAEAGSGA